MELIEMIQQICQNTVKASALADVVVGTVASANPLQITVNTAMAPLNRSVLYLTEGVIAQTATAKASEGEVTLTGTKGGVPLPAKGDTVTLNPGLAAGDKVLLLRVQGGQRFVVLSRVY